MSEYTLRPGTAADIETMARHRALMFADMGDGTPETRAEMSERFAPWVLERLASGEYHAWLIECDGGVVAGAACWEKPRHPGLRGTHPRVAYVLNVYTDPEHRGRGLARMLMEHILGWARAEGFATVELHASDEGRPLYEKLGFGQTNEMRLVL